MNTSAMSPAESRVLTRLSPSDPPGRVSCLMVMLGFAAVKALITAFALATSVSVVPVRNVIVVLAALPELPGSLLPRLPALQPAATRALVAAKATSATPRRRPDVLNLMEPPGVGRQRGATRPAGRSASLPGSFQRGR